MAGYQVMPRMSPERYESLELDIIENGVQVPILVAQDGTIIDGHHRDEIARKHDLHCPRTIVEGDEVKLRSLAYSLNANRRDLSREQRDEMLKDSLRKDPILRDSEHARRTGFDPKTVKRVRADEGIPTPDEVIWECAEAHPGKSIRDVAQDLGVDKDTVHRIVSQKREFPENGTPADEPVAVVGPNEEIPATTIIGTKDLAPTPEPSLSFDDEPEDDEPEWEEVAHIPQARLRDVAPRPTAVNIPQGDLDALNTAPGKPPAGPAAPKIHKPLDEDYFDPKDHRIKMLQEVRKAEKALKELLYLAQHIDSWSQGSLTDGFRDLLDEIDQTLNSGGMDAALARLIEGETK